MAVVAYGNPERTFLQATDRLLSSVGKGNIITVSNPSRHTLLAMRAVSDARDDIFYKKLWQWRREHFEIDLVAQQMWYALPANYHKMASSISLNRLDKMVDYLEYDDLLRKWPYLRSFPPGAGVGGLEQLNVLLDQTDAFGEPDNYTIWQNDYIGLFRIPDSTFVDTEVTVYAHYWRHPVTLSEDNDDLDLPRELWSAHDLLASSRLKKALEYSDWAADKAEGLALLDERVAGRKEDEDKGFYQNTQINYNE